MLTASKKGVSAHQMHRSLGVSYKSTWFMMHRLREALRQGGLAPMGGTGKTIEINETFYGKQFGAPKRIRPGLHTSWRNTVLALVERGGSVRTFHITGTTMAELLPVIRFNVNRESALMTDEWRAYKPLATEYASHETVDHSKKEYVRGTVIRRIFLHFQAWHEGRLSALAVRSTYIAILRSSIFVTATALALATTI
jgi:transposase-like protein